MFILFLSVIVLHQFSFGVESYDFERMILLSNSFTVTHNRVFEKNINSTLECIRNEMNHGLPEWGLPHFNPLRLADVKINLIATGIEGISGFIYVEDLSVAGLTDWTITAVKGVIAFLPPSYKADVAINFPQIVLSATYKANVTVDSCSFWGEGILEFDAIDFDGIVDFKANVVGKFYLQYFKFTASLSSLKHFIISGLRGDEVLSSKVSHYIQANGPKLVAFAGPTLTKIIEKNIVNLVNNGEENNLLAELLSRCRKTKISVQ